MKCEACQAYHFYPTCLINSTMQEKEDAVKPVFNRPRKNRQNKGLNRIWQLDKGQKYRRRLHGEHSAIILICVMGKLVLEIKIFSAYSSVCSRQASLL